MSRPDTEVLIVYGPHVHDAKTNRELEIVACKFWDAGMWNEDIERSFVDLRDKPESIRRLVMMVEILGSV
jgi:hypothetical protein